MLDGEDTAAGLRSLAESVQCFAVEKRAAFRCRNARSVSHRKRLKTRNPGWWARNGESGCTPAPLFSAQPPARFKHAS